ncbi:BamA/TamA family outer membrane protein [Segetibacter sp.]|jgi:outer membrane protein insertion porin family|uniref:translocation and assembly module lipoprotein TamL n=1 Tax=Segetibacter sp. TaxID=2231182 RepID=UPI002619AFC5|nr:BamA/TamA family outer membrane protein [Segetibacter sp.]MCW3082072.1 surface antigen [Segetibacter sp.]
MQIRKSKLLTYYSKITAIGILLSGCNITKKVPEGDALYTGHKVKVENASVSNNEKKVITADLQALIRPRPNSRLLGIPFKLGLYNMAGKKNNFINKFLRKNGEPPVLLSSVKLERNLQVLTNTLENRGFFHAKTTADTVVKDKKASASYVANTGSQYKINEVSFPKDSSAISRAIQSISNKTIFKKGDAFNLDVVKGERLRIDAALKEEGFYFFSPDDLIIFVDSTIGNNLTNLYVSFKPDVQMARKQAYTINDIYIYSNYNLNTARRDTLKADSVLYKGYYVIDRNKTFKPLVFEQMMLFKPGDLYNRTDHNQSLNRLTNLGAFKFVKNRFDVVADSFKLNTYYFLTPLPRKSLSAEIGGLTKSNNATGSEVTVRWKNRNAFRGAEQLSINAYFGTEVQVSGSYSGFNTLRYGAELNLSLPRFVIPFFDLNTTGAYVPRTTIQFGYDILQRQKLYSLNSYRANLGYNWKESAQKEHQLNPISVTYVQPLNVTQRYIDSILLYPVLQRAIQPQFILGSTYNYNYNQLVGREKNASGIYFNGLLDVAGNVLGLASGADAKNGKVQSLFGSPFSQYVKAEFDMRLYRKVGLNSQWANRLIVGLGYPYGNSTILPFVKQYFVGGNNSLRGFRSRSVGPGKFVGGQVANRRGFYPDVTGDLKLEMNTEYRPKLFSILYGAVFLDAGNVWLVNDNIDPTTGANLYPGGKFSKNFLKELAVDAGVGLRIDIQILLLRLDLAVPLRKPWLPEGQRTVLNQIDFGSSEWRSNNLILNLGIGLPF